MTSERRYEIRPEFGRGERFRRFPLKPAPLFKRSFINLPLRLRCSSDGLMKAAAAKNVIVNIEKVG